MNLRKIWIFRIGLLLMLFIFAPPLLLADNCSADSDCFPTLAAAAAAGSGARGVGDASSLWWRNAQQGFVFMAGKGSSIDRHAGPSSNSSVVGSEPFGLRLLYRGTATDDQGKVWYHVQTADGGGWISSDDASDTRPMHTAPLKPIRLIDPGSNAHTSGGITTADRG